MQYHRTILYLKLSIPRGITFLVALHTFQNFSNLENEFELDNLRKGTAIARVLQGVTINEVPLCYMRFENIENV